MISIDLFRDNSKKARWKSETKSENFFSDKTIFLIEKEILRFCLLLNLSVTEFCLGLNFVSDYMPQLYFVCNHLIYSVKIMLEKLDPEQLGIVTLNAFMEEFFPNHNSQNVEQTFTLNHYNGLRRSCPNNKVHIDTNLSFR